MPPALRQLRRNEPRPMQAATGFVLNMLHRPAETYAGSRRHGLLCLQDDVGDDLWRGEQWRVIDSERSRGGAHSFRHELLGFGINHAVFFGGQEPRRLRFPRRLCHRLLNASAQAP